MLFRLLLALAVFFSLAQAHGASDKPMDVRFSPVNGNHHGTRFVTLQFPQTMIAIGELAAKDAAEVSCSMGEGGAGVWGKWRAPDLSGKGRWSGQTQWLYEFKRPLPDGVRCRVRMLLAAPKQGWNLPAQWEFDTGGARVLDHICAQQQWQNGIQLCDENGEMLFGLSAPVDPASLTQLRCVVDGVETKLSVAPQNDETEAKINKLFKKNFSEVDRHYLVLTRCGQTPPKALAKVEWQWSKDVRTMNGLQQREAVVFTTQMRDWLTAQFQCGDSTFGACHLRDSVTLTFSTAIPKATLDKIVVQGSSGKQYRARSYGDASNYLQFNERFVPDETLHVLLPPDVRDNENRPLQLSASKLDDLVIASPKFVRMPQQYGVLQALAGSTARWPIFTDRTRNQLQVGMWHLPANSDTRALLALHADQTAPMPKEVAQAFALNRMILKKHGASDSKWQQSTIATTQDWGTAMRVAQVPLTGLGTWVVEAQAQDPVGNKQGLGGLYLALNEQGRVLSNFDHIVDLAGAQQHLQQIAQQTKASQAEVVIGADVGGHLHKMCRDLGIVIKPHDYTNPRFQYPYQHPRLALVQLTNLHIDAHLSKGGDSLLWITAIDSGKPVANASVEIWHDEKQRLWQLQSDAQGRVVLPHFTPKPEMAYPGWIVARAGQDVVVLAADWMQKGWRTDGVYLPQIHSVMPRNLLRAGEILTMQHIMRQPSAKGWALPTSEQMQDIVIDIFSPGQSTALLQKALAFDQARNPAGVAETEWQIPQDAKLGMYRFQIYNKRTGAPLESGEFNVAEFRVSSFAAQLQLRHAWGDGKTAQNGQKGQPMLQVQPSLSYLAGGAAAQEKVEVKVKFDDAVVGPDPEFHYLDAEQATGSRLDRLRTELTLDDKGQASHTFPVLNLKNPAQARVEMQFRDANGEVQTQQSTIEVWPQQIKLGIRAWQHLDGGAIVVQAVAFDRDNKPVPHLALTLDAARIQGNDVGTSSKVIVDDAARIPVCNAKTDAEGMVRCQLPAFKPNEEALALPGWLFRARAKDASTATYRARKYELQATALRLNQAPYLAWHSPLPALAGSNAQLKLMAPFLPASVLLTVEREGVLASQVHQLTQAEQVVNLPIALNYAPGVQVKVRFVRGSAYAAQGQVSAWSGKMAAGVANAIADTTPSLVVENEIALPIAKRSTALAINIAPAQNQVKPGALLPVKLTVKNALTGAVAGKAQVTVFAVDEGLLAQQENLSWWVQDYFTEIRKSDVRVRAVLDEWWYQDLALASRATMAGFEDKLFQRWLSAERYLAPEYEQNNRAHLNVDAFRDRKRFRPPERINDEEELSAQRVEITGSSIARADSRAYSHPASAAPSNALQKSQPEGGITLRSNFKTLAFWRSQVSVNAQGVAQVEIPLPDSITRWRIVAVALEGGHLMGSAEKSVQANLPVQLLSGLPPVVRSGDLVQQGVTIRNTSEKALDLILLRSAQAGTGIAPVTQKIRLARDENRVLNFAFSVPEGPAAIDWTFTAQQANGTVLDALKVTQELRPALALTMIGQSLLQVVPQNQAEVNTPPQAQRAQVKVHWQDSLAQASLPSAREWMRAYPYMCIEQRSSKAVVSGVAQEWEAVLASIPQHLDSNDLLGYFPRGEGSETLTMYVLDLAQYAQLPLPQQERMLAALRKRFVLPASEANAVSSVRRWEYRDKAYLLQHKLAMQATLATLARKLGAPPIVPDDLTQLPASALIDWARYLLASEETPQKASQLTAVARELRLHMQRSGNAITLNDPQNSYYWWRMANNATVLARASLLLQEWRKIDASWNVEWPLLINGLVAQQRQGHWLGTTGNALAVVAIQGFMREVEKPILQGESSARIATQSLSSVWPKPQPMQFDLPLSAKNQTVQLTHKGDGAPWATVAVYAALKVDQSIEQGMRVKKRIEAVEQKVKGKWSVGDLLKVTLELHAANDFGITVVYDPIPSGASILGKGLARESAINNDQLARENWHQPDWIERTHDSYRGYYERIWDGTWHLSYLLRLNNAGHFKLPATHVEAMYMADVFGDAPNAEMEVLP